MNNTDKIKKKGETSENKLDCPICQNTGFSQGKVCVCISGLKDGDILDFLKSTFGVTK